MKTILSIVPLCFLACVSLSQAQDGTWQLRSGEVVAVLGGTNAVNLQSAGYFETLLTLTNAEARPRFIDLAWEGDTVYRQGTVIERWREEKFGDLANQLTENKVTFVVVQFGQNESLDGMDRLDEFSETFEELLSVCKQHDRRVVVSAPIPFEKGDPLQPDLSKRNSDLAEYVRTMRELAKEHDCRCVDLFSKFSKHSEKLTTNGMHVAKPAQQAIAQAMLPTVANRLSDKQFESLRTAIASKHRLWMNYWRPANWKCLYGDDGEREFGKSTAGGLSLRQEWEKLPDMISNAERQIWDLAKELNDLKDQK